MEEWGQRNAENQKKRRQDARKAKIERVRAERVRKTGGRRSQTNGPDPETGYWPGTEHLTYEASRLERYAKIGHAEPFETLEEGVAFWQSHGYKLEDRSAGRAELKSPHILGAGFWITSIIGLIIWPMLVLLPLMILMQARERVLLEVVEGKVVESRSMAMSKFGT